MHHPDYFYIESIFFSRVQKKAPRCFNAMFGSPIQIYNLPYLECNFHTYFRCHRPIGMSRTIFIIRSQGETFLRGSLWPGRHQSQRVGNKIAHPRSSRAFREFLAKLQRYVLRDALSFPSAPGPSSNVAFGADQGAHIIDVPCSSRGSCYDEKEAFWSRKGEISHKSIAINCSPGDVEAALSSTRGQRWRRNWGKGRERGVRWVRTADHCARPSTHRDILTN